MTDHFRTKSYIITVEMKILFSLLYILSLLVSVYGDCSWKTPDGTKLYNLTALVANVDYNGQYNSGGLRGLLYWNFCKATTVGNYLRYRICNKEKVVPQEQYRVNLSVENFLVLAVSIMWNTQKQHQ